jgi:hypothetical protein
MPRAKKTTTKKSVGRKVQRRVASDRRRVEDVFWNKVIEGFKKLLSPAFKRTGLNFRK